MSTFRDRKDAAELYLHSLSLLYINTLTVHLCGSLFLNTGAVPGTHFVISLTIHTLFFPGMFSCSSLCSLCDNLTKLRINLGEPDREEKYFRVYGSITDIFFIVSVIKL
jgi:hypothetical protein